LRLSLGLSLKRRASGSFDPATLFAGAAGSFFDVSDLSTVFADTAGTTPASVDGAVARISDKSGNGNHLLQATASLRPLLRQSGSLYYLEFDGTDDFLQTASGYARTSPMDRISAIQQISWAADQYIYDGGLGTNGWYLIQTGTTPQIQQGSGPTSTGLAVGADGVVSERFDAGLSTLTIDNGAASTPANAGAAVAGLTVGTPHNGSSALASNIRLYSLFERCGTLTGAEMTSLRTFMAAKQGRVL
jgi:hypothetical protein